MFSSMLLGIRVGVANLLGGFVVILGTVLAVSTGYLSKPVVPISDWIYLSQHAIAFVAIGVIQYIWIKNHHEDLSQIQIELATRKKIQREMESFFEASLDAIVVFDRSGPIFGVNKAFTEWVGQSSDDVSGNLLEDYTHPDDREIVRSWVKRIASGEDIDDGLLRFLDAEGNTRWINWRISVDPGNFEHAFAIGRDVTRLREETQRLQESAIRAQEQADCIIQIATHEAVASGDLANGLKVLAEVSGKVLDVERTSVWMFEDDESELKCQVLHLLSGQEADTEGNLKISDFPRYFDSIRDGRFIDADDAMSDQRTAELTGEYLLPLRISSLIDAPVRVGGKVVAIVCFEHVGEIRRWLSDEKTFVGIIADQVAQLITAAARREAELLLRKLNEELETRVADRTQELQDKNQELETFAYSVSHDLRSPLRAIAGYNQMLKEDYVEVLDETAQGYIGRVEAAVLTMSQLIQDLLTYSRFERRAITETTIHLPTLVERILDDLHLAQANNGFEIEVDIADFEICTDSDGVAMALRNLIDNAVKFSKGQPSPRIVVRAALDGPVCEITVRDNGIGFEQKYSEKIFEIFQRLERVDAYPGTGVGLAIVRKAIQRIGGSVTCESEPGKGATFHLRVPDKAAMML
ncbi:MAG: PAS domain S-box protein [Fimbriimonadaceae bacterium]|nr:PAS domain S-box protein [Fimbriimonadaceae bacterium]